MWAAEDTRIVKCVLYVRKATVDINQEITAQNALLKELGRRTIDISLDAGATGYLGFELYTIPQEQE